MATFSSLIVQHDVAPMRTVEEAIARQVLHGGDLATSLLEQANVDEARIAEALGLFHDAPAHAGKLPTPTPEALFAVPVDVLARHGFVPIACDGDELIVVVPEPLTSAVETELCFTLGFRFVQHVAPFVRVRQALAEHFGVALERRLVRLITRLDGTPPVVGQAPQRVSRPESRPVPPPPPTQPSAPPPAPVPSSPPPAAFVPSSPPPAASVPSSPPLAAFVPSSPPLAAFVPPSPPPAVVSVAPTETVRRLADKERRELPRPARKKGPFLPAAAEQELADAPSTDAILETLFTFAAQYFAHTALFTVQGETAELREVAGIASVAPPRAAVVVSLASPSVLASARNSGFPSLIRLSSGEVDVALQQELGRTKAGASTRALALIPLLVRGRVVALLLGDDGPDDANLGELGDLVALTHRAAVSLERLLLARKRGGKETSFPAISLPAHSPRPEPVAAVDSVKGLEALARIVAPSPVAEPEDRLSSNEFAAPEPSVPSGRVAQLPTPPPPGPAAHAEPRPLRGFGGGSPWTPRQDDVFTSVTEGDLDRARPTAGAPRPLRRPVVPRHEPIDDEPTRVAEHDGYGEGIFDEVTVVAPADRLFGGIDDEETAVVAPGSDLLRAGEEDAARYHGAGPKPTLLVTGSADIGGLLARVVDGGLGAREAADAIVARGEHALPFLMASFPGPIRTNRRAVLDDLVHAADCGPILGLVARMGRAALPFITVRSAAADPDIRFWATHLLGDLSFTESANALLPRLFDEDLSVRKVARHAAAHLVARGEGASTVLTVLEDIAKAPDEPILRRVLAVEALGELLSESAVPTLLSLLRSHVPELAEGARRALTVVTRHDFGRDRDAWYDWWQLHAGKLRPEWLIDALAGESPALRRAALDELALLSGYRLKYEDFESADRARARAYYREWWDTEGRPSIRGHIGR
jgi:hypothetical protein